MSLYDLGFVELIQSGLSIVLKKRGSKVGVKLEDIDISGKCMHTMYNLP